MQFIDLTHSFDEHISLFPGTEPPQIEKENTIEQHGFSQLKITMVTHMGTHIDAPFHILSEGKKLDEFKVEKFQGSALKVDINASDAPVIPLSNIETLNNLLPRADFLLVNTGWSKHWKRKTYQDEYPTLSLEAAKYLSQFKLKGIGMDTFSPDPINSRELPIHKIFLKKEILIIENLTNLEQLPINQLFKFWAMPLKISQADGSPVRAFAQISFNK